MSRYQFRLPDVGEGVAEAEITVWHIKVGDTVKEDQSLVDVMTDKATVDMTSPVDGVVTAIHGEVGSMRAVGSVLVELDVEGAGNADAAAEVPAPEVAHLPAAHSSPEPAANPAWPSGAAFTPRVHTGTPPAAPSTRRRARQLGVALEEVVGSGSGGRITPQDLDDHVARRGVALSGGAGDARYAARNGVTDTKIIGLRRKIGERMQDAKRRIPHIAYVEEMDVTELEALRRNLNDHKAPTQPKLTLLPFFMRALVRVMPEFPHLNARYDDEAGILHAHEAVHIGIATQTPSGLMVPVVRHVETLDIWAIAAELSRLGAAARDGSARREELSGSTITITSLGTLGGIVSTPVINHPEVAIVGPNKIVDRPVVEGSFVTVRKMMNLSSSFDHRIVDGYDAALFVQRLKRLIEHPALIFIE
jgi:2-oxoisovalerate dehydrogenase E2 component (dihydrolipoyl transacylase)